MSACLVICPIIFLLIGILSIFVNFENGFRDRMIITGAFIASIIGCVPVASVLISHAPIDVSIPLELPIGAFHLRLDALSAWFLTPVLILAFLCAFYGTGCLGRYKNHKHLGVSWFFYFSSVMGMVLVTISADMILFLFAWEIMSLSSFFLVIFEHEKPHIRHAGWIYLTAAKIGAACIFLSFFILFAHTGKTDFRIIHLAAAPGTWCLILALIGFGSKAGIVPFHVWLPEAYPAAPSHAAALMSGAMVKMGIYGFLRLCQCYAVIPDWLPWALLILGGISGIIGILFAISQYDLKKLLANSSTEHIGIIFMGLGLSMLSIKTGHEALGALVLCGTLCHIWNHSIFKSALFLGADIISQATGTLDLNKMGGLSKQLPLITLSVFIPLVAITGLPPFNGFISEALIYLGAFKAIASESTRPLFIAGTLVVGSFALIGGLSALCFSNVFGRVFLGPSSNDIQTQPSNRLVAPLLILSSLCVIMGIAGVVPVALSTHVVHTLVGTNLSASAGQALASRTACWLGASFGGIISLILLIVFIRHRLALKRPRHTAVTWDCGFIKPLSRARYTASSFAQPVIESFSLLLRPQEKMNKIEGYYATKQTFKTQVPDLFTQRLYTPLFEKFAAFCAWSRVLQHGRIRVYVLYIITTLIILIVLKVVR